MRILSFYDINKSYKFAFHFLIKISLPNEKIKFSFAIKSNLIIKRIYYNYIQ